jgi:hypothetical protein
MAAYGLYTHIQSNRRRSIALLAGLFFLVYVLVYAGALVAVGLSFNADLPTLMQIAWIDLLKAAPFATVGTLIWIVIAYYFHQNMIDAITGGREVARTDEPRLYKILENLCISRGITTPKLKLIDSDALNAFATGMNDKQYSITVTTGLLSRLNDAEIESVLGHELTHIRNGDVRMMVIAVVIAGVVSFFVELIFRLWFYNGFSFRGSRGDDRRDQKSRRHDLGTTQDRVPRRIAGRDIFGDGNVHRQSARGFWRIVRYPSERRKPRRGAGQIRRRPRPRPDRAAAAKRRAIRSRRAIAGSRSRSVELNRDRRHDRQRRYPRTVSLWDTGKYPCCGPVVATFRGTKPGASV